MVLLCIKPTLTLSKVQFFQIFCLWNSCQSQHKLLSTFLVYICLYSPTVDNTFLCLFYSTRFGDYTTIIRSSSSLDRVWFIFIAGFSLITLFLVVYILVLKVNIITNTGWLVLNCFKMSLKSLTWFSDLKTMISLGLPFYCKDSDTGSGHFFYGFIRIYYLRIRKHSLTQHIHDLIGQ